MNFIFYLFIFFLSLRIKNITFQCYPKIINIIVHKFEHTLNYKLWIILFTF